MRATITVIHRKCYNKKRAHQCLVKLTMASDSSGGCLECLSLIHFLHRRRAVANKCHDSSRKLHLINGMCTMNGERRRPLVAIDAIASEVGCETGKCDHCQDNTSNTCQ